MTIICVQCGADSHTTEEHDSVTETGVHIVRRYTTTSPASTQVAAIRDACDLESCGETIGGRHFVIAGMTDLFFHSHECARAFHAATRKA